MTEQTKETIDRAVRIRIRSLQYDYRESLSERISELERRVKEALLSETAEESQEDEALYDDSACGEAGEPYEMVTDGRFRMKGSLCELSYMENDENGMGETRTTLVFSKNRPWILTLTRSGVVRMTLSFEAGRHHIGTYHFGAMQRMISDRPNVMIASYARRVENRILEDGTLDLDYIVEVRGMDTQRTVFSLSIGELSLAPKGLSEQSDGGENG